MRFFILFAFLALYRPISANYTYCYACNQSYVYDESVAHDVCASRQLVSTLVNISCNPLNPDDSEKGTKQVCYKLKKPSKKYDNETFIYERGCAAIGGKVDFCIEKRKIDAELECFLCEGNNCNDANDMHVVRFLMFLLAVFLVLYMRDQAERNQLRESRPVKW